MQTPFPPARELIPHAGRAVLIDGVLDDTDDRIHAVAAITPAHPFFVAGRGVPSWVGIELMAQAIAAHAGLNGRREQRAPRAGMLLGTRRYRATSAWFSDSMQLDVFAQREFGDSGGLAACACRIECAGRLLAEASIIIVEMDTVPTLQSGAAP
ncbi:MAG TPA: 3-hydroxydecanoyl-ACP dehydratase [Gammaproteobacteria bacterium]|nr:3-hydroxydecanoyl-ACP dehydratase [Gammaproteobacteria bacterium]